MQRAWHTNFHGNPPPLQPSFDQGSIRLIRDDDECIPDGDPRLANPNVANADDVPAYYEFLIKDDATSKILVGANGKYLPSGYFDIRYKDRIDTLLYDLSLPTVRQVNTIVYSEQLPDGSTAIHNVRGVATIYRTIVYTRDTDPRTLVHEWMHTADINHRGEKNKSGVVTNPGPSRGAIMATPPDGDKVNRYERSKLWQEYN
jgi:hypothetical protein